MFFENQNLANSPFDLGATFRIKKQYVTKPSRHIKMKFVIKEFFSNVTKSAETADLDIY